MQVSENNRMMMMMMMMKTMMSKMINTMIKQKAGKKADFGRGITHGLGQSRHVYALPRRD